MFCYDLLRVVTTNALLGEVSQKHTKRRKPSDCVVHKRIKRNPDWTPSVSILECKTRVASCYIGYEDGPIAVIPGKLWWHCFLPSKIVGCCLDGNDFAVISIVLNQRFWIKKEWHMSGVFYFVSNSHLYTHTLSIKYHIHPVTFFFLSERGILRNGF